MRWVSNGDAPIYVWSGDVWYNQKDKMTYAVDTIRGGWVSNELIVYFTKKTRMMG